MGFAKITYIFLKPLAVESRMRYAKKYVRLLGKPAYKQKPQLTIYSNQFILIRPYYYFNQDEDFAPEN